MVDRGELTDRAWARIEPLLPPVESGGRRWRDHRQVINAILWKLRTGAPCRDLPEVRWSSRPESGPVPDEPRHEDGDGRHEQLQTEDCDPCRPGCEGTDQDRGCAQGANEKDCGGFAGPSAHKDKTRTAPHSVTAVPGLGSRRVGVSRVPPGSRFAHLRSDGVPGTGAASSARPPAAASAPSRPRRARGDPVAGGGVGSPCCRGGRPPGENLQIPTRREQDPGTAVTM